MTTLQDQINGASDIEAALNVTSSAAQTWDAGVRAANTAAGDALTAILTGIYALGVRFNGAGKAYENALWERQIAKPASGGNPWLQTLYMATGEFDHAADKVVTKDPSNEARKLTRTKFHKGEMLQKYAGALRYLEQESITVEGVAKFVREFKEKNPGLPGGWGGIVKIERDARKAAGTTKSREVHDAELLKVAEDALLNAAPAEIRERAAKAKTRQFIRAWGVMLDGEFVFGGFVKDSEGAAKTEAQAFAKAVEQSPVEVPSHEPNFDVVDDSDYTEAAA
ncbi:MAG: hypothetical protein FP819_03630 [Rhizobiaceae bacterium]|nr:hypothetical protein [Rhizobiaceae bacterium]